MFISLFFFSSLSFRFFFFLFDFQSKGYHLTQLPSWYMKAGLRRKCHKNYLMCRNIKFYKNNRSSRLFIAKTKKETAMVYSVMVLSIVLRRVVYIQIILWTIKVLFFWLIIWHFKLDITQTSSGAICMSVRKNTCSVCFFRA